MKTGIPVMSSRVKPVWTAWLAVLAAALAAILAAGVLVAAAGPAEAAFPGKNGKVFFQSDRDGNPHIYSINPNGTGLSRLTFTAANTDPAVSPDGTKIASVSTDSQIFVMNADGSGRMQITTSTSKSDPAWSPDGSKIAYVANSFDVDGQTDLEIWAINANGAGRTQLTNNTFPDSQPAWSPDGTRIAFVSARTGDTDRNVYVMNSGGSGQTSVTPNSPSGCSSNCYQGHDDDPTWSPDGLKIAYVHGYGPPTNPFAGGGLPNIWTMDPNGANKANVSNNPDVSAIMPSYAPDSSKIAYVGATDTNRDIWIMNSDGTGQQILQANTANDIEPDWQQDSIPPNTTITSGPPALTRSTTASFGFVSSETGSTFQCSLDGAAYANCVSPKSYTVANGTHTFRARATDVAGNVDATPAVRSWTVDTIRPAISNVSPKPGARIKDRTPTIKATVRDNLTNLAKSNVKLYVNGKLISAAKYTYSQSTDQLIHKSPKLSKGKKTIKVVATDAAGNAGLGSWAFRVR